MKFWIVAFGAYGADALVEHVVLQHLCGGQRVPVAGAAHRIEERARPPRLRQWAHSESAAALWVRAIKGAADHLLRTPEKGRSERTTAA